jgi:hypothetical protein
LTRWNDDGCCADIDDERQRGSGGETTADRRSVCIFFALHGGACKAHAGGIFESHDYAKENNGDNQSSFELHDESLGIEADFEDGNTSSMIVAPNTFATDPVAVSGDLATVKLVWVNAASRYEMRNAFSIRTVSHSFRLDGTVPLHGLPRLCR